MTMSSSVRASIAIYLPQHVTTGVTAEVVLQPETGQASISAPPSTLDEEGSRAVFGWMDDPTILHGFIGVRDLSRGAGGPH